MAELINPFTGGSVTVPDEVAGEWVARGFRVPTPPPAPKPRRKRSSKSE